MGRVKGVRGMKWAKKNLQRTQIEFSGIWTVLYRTPSFDSLRTRCPDLIKALINLVLTKRIGFGRQTLHSLDRIASNFNRKKSRVKQTLLPSPGARTGPRRAKCAGGSKKRGEFVLVEDINLQRRQ